MPSSWQELAAEFADPHGRKSQEYSFYGLTICSEIPLTFPLQRAASEIDVRFSLIPRDRFNRITSSLERNHDPDRWYEHVNCPDGADYLRWDGLFEFLVSPDGRSVACGLLDDASAESFETYLLGHVLSFALLKQGHEPLHATVVVVDGLAVGLVGQSGMGKSTLAAAFLKAGNQLLTDDMLLAREVDGCMYAFGGPARIKLLPEVARHLLPGKSGGARMNPLSEKLVIPLKSPEWHPGPLPLEGFFVLDEVESAASPMRIELLHRSAAMLELLRATFNTRVRHPDRLRRQFGAARRLSTRVPVRRLSYPRTISTVEDVRDAIVAAIGVRTTTDA